MSFDFIRPTYLALLALVPLLIFLHFFTLKRKRSHALHFANFDAIARVKGIDLISKNIVILSISILISVLLILALTGVNVQRSLYSSSFSFVIAIDSSKSMEATDFLPSRLDAAKQTAVKFVETSPVGTRAAIVSFSGNAFIEQTMTQDKGFLTKAIQDIPLSSVGGTDLNEAVITGTNLLESEEAKSIILISDGKINVGSIEESINYANSHDVIIHTIGIGSEEGGTTSYGLSKIDEDALKALAHNTQGQYFKVENIDELEQSFANIIQLEFRKVTTDIAPYFIVAALALFIIEFILISTRYKVLP
ncbi:MAG: VWA domain-containing protein [Nanoarchaeota archaeon]|nr:VWA domain-containing protein [Nanoarchaeota archaeon]